MPKQLDMSNIRHQVAAAVKNLEKKRLRITLALAALLSLS